MLRKELLKGVSFLVRDELNAANLKFPLFSSPHEGYAVIKEEVEEAMEDANEVVENLEVLWSIIRENEAEMEAIDYIKDYAMYAVAEFVQVVAMCEKYKQSLGNRGQL